MHKQTELSFRRERLDESNKGEATSAESAQQAGVPRHGEIPVERYLSAIIAHELGNPFTALLGRLELLEIRKGMPDGVRRDLEAMRTAGDRMARILENLKAFSRGESTRPRGVTLSTAIQAAATRFATLEPGIEVIQNPVPAKLKVQAEPEMLEECIVATLQAMVDRGGETVTRVELGWGQDAEVDEISVVMQDDGRLLTEDEVDRVFHPFSGTELNSWRGLVTLSYGYYIIRAWGGTFRFPRSGVSTTELCLVALR